MKEASLYVRRTRRSTANRRFLVFTSAGNQCLPSISSWLSSPTHIQFDLNVVFYKATARNPVFQKLTELANRLQGVNIVVRKGYKWPNFNWWLERNREKIGKDGYTHIWVADDDLIMDTYSINAMFQVMEASPVLVVASPSYTRDSGGMWRYHDIHNPNFIFRLTNFIECTGPVLSAKLIDSELFQRCLASTRTGYYLDNCFYPSALTVGGSVGIIDTVICKHPDRPLQNKEMYTELSSLDHTQDYRFFDSNQVPRSAYWFREPIYLPGSPRRPHVPAGLEDQQIGLAPKEIHNRVLRAMFPSRFGPEAKGAAVDPDREDFRKYEGWDAEELLDFLNREGHD
ncbi:hypothetical protein AAMO2058_000761600 [Amorphochlora amoebiformis]